MDRIHSMRVLVAGWFSFEDRMATAGDLLSCEVVCQWLGSRKILFDRAVAPPNGRFSWDKVNEKKYSHLVFVCGPYAQDWIPRSILTRFAHCRKIGLDLTMLDETNPFDVLFTRHERPDLVFASETIRVPLIGLVLVHPQFEYGKRSKADPANDALRTLARSRDSVPIEIDTRLDGRNASGYTTPAQVESAIARMDVILTTRLHGMALALKNGVPAVVVDSVSGGAKITQQARVLGWPVFNVDRLNSAKLKKALEECLQPEARQKARACGEEAARKILSLQKDFFQVFREET
jgi:Polysaccharide pyruvyl transferase